MPEEQVKRKRLKPQKSHDSIIEETILVDAAMQNPEIVDEDHDDNDNNGAMSLLLAEVGKL